MTNDDFDSLWKQNKPDRQDYDSDAAYQADAAKWKAEKEAAEKQRKEASQNDDFNSRVEEMNRARRAARNTSNPKPNTSQSTSPENPSPKPKKSKSERSSYQSQSPKPKQEEKQEPPKQKDLPIKDVKPANAIPKGQNLKPVKKKLDAIAKNATKSARNSSVIRTQITGEMRERVMNIGANVRHIYTRINQTENNLQGRIDKNTGLLRGLLRSNNFITDRLVFLQKVGSSISRRILKRVGKPAKAKSQNAALLNVSGGPSLKPPKLPKTLRGRSPGRKKDRNELPLQLLNEIKTIGSRYSSEWSTGTQARILANMALPGITALPGIFRSLSGTKKGRGLVEYIDGSKLHGIFRPNRKNPKTSPYNIPIQQTQPIPVQPNAYSLMSYAGSTVPISGANILSSANPLNIATASQSSLGLIGHPNLPIANTTKAEQTEIQQDQQENREDMLTKLKDIFRPTREKEEAAKKSEDKNLFEKLVSSLFSENTISSAIKFLGLVVSSTAFAPILLAIGTAVAIKYNEEIGNALRKYFPGLSKLDKWIDDRERDKTIQEAETQYNQEAERAYLQAVNGEKNPHPGNPLAVAAYQEGLEKRKQLGLKEGQKYGSFFKEAEAARVVNQLKKDNYSLNFDRPSLANGIPFLPTSSDLLQKNWNGFGLNDFNSIKDFAVPYFDPSPTIGPKIDASNKMNDAISDHLLNTVINYNNITNQVNSTSPSNNYLAPTPMFNYSALQTRPGWAPQ